MVALRIFIYVVIGFLFWAGYVRFFESRSIFFPDKNINSTPRDMGWEYEDVYFETADGLSLNGWLVKTDPSSSTVIFCHGNAGNISDRLDKIALFRNLGLNVFIFDYRGYGRSQGRPSEEGLYRDASAAYDYIKGRQDRPDQQVIVYGCSLGGVPAVDLAARQPVDALILDSTFSSAVDMAKVMLPLAPAFLIRSKMDSVSKIKKVRCPILFIHSEEDEIVPFALGQKLFRAAPQPKEFLVSTGDHNYGYLTFLTQYGNGLREFLKKYNLIR